MFTLIKGVWNKIFEKPTYKVLIIGLDGSGKTQSAGQKIMSYEKIIPTVGLNNKFQALFWDLGGQQMMRTIWKKYYADCHGIIFVIDADWKKRTEELEQCFCKDFEFILQKDHEGVPILILVNKSDLFDVQTINTIQQELNNLLKVKEVNDRQITIKSISVTKVTNIQESLDWLFTQINSIAKLESNK